jgi:ribose 5-phosphate isomerase B
MKISIGADHRGFALKTNIIEHFDEHEWLDVGTYSDQRTDYPLFARRVCQDIVSQVADCGILICATGVGMAIAANRFKNIYAALCWNVDIARLAKQHDGTNVLVLPSDFISAEQAFAMIDVWLTAEFKEGVYQRRLEIIDEE